jgi:hypothetical protein
VNAEFVGASAALSGRTGSLLAASAVTGAVYAVLVAIVTALLAFPGLGVVFLPQPFLEVVVGKTMFYSFSGLEAVAWVAYVLVAHLVLYYLVEGVLKVRRSYLAVSIILYFVNLVLVLAGVSHPSLPFYVYRDTMGRAGFLVGIAITVLMELAGRSLARHLLRGSS